MRKQGAGEQAERSWVTLPGPRGLIAGSQAGTAQAVNALWEQSVGTLQRQEVITGEEMEFKEKEERGGGGQKARKREEEQRGAT